MIRPTNTELLAGVAEALKETVLPELARGTAARKQLQAAIEILRRVAFALPNEAAVLEADNADMAEVLTKAATILGQSAPTTRASESAPARNLALQSALNELQERVPAELHGEIDALLTGLYSRMTDRALALIPPPASRTSRNMP
jgi:hypothetical protein